VVVDEVEQASGRGDEHIGAAAEGHELRVDRDAAVDDQGFKRRRKVAAVAAHGLADLRGELARRREN
jgi:hypothetical protein